MNLSKEQLEAMRQKERVLKGGYAPIPHFIYRELLPELKTKYDGKKARDCLTLYMYVHAYVNGQSEQQAYLWAFPSVTQIAEDTGIHKDRIKGLFDILVSEGVMITRKIPWYGHTKKMYMPLYERKDEA
ncbi:Uncharacterised protein [Niallia circulans]|uniref:hypothetical protein n=1 Tax=Niallia circulans TaxID=1397 RepID=UPI00077C3B46|nr:hypothetical protein [Niallia circulans]MDR4318690.1 hypothetical protein [Niallia circulans]MED3839349.1 hypothetical protein [Niallia circulans]MED4245332.1 hypothetical protein [Niallia circulans]MED4250867.1 hypothetical protein [Niallia circulans]QKH60147.1 hypothetical protein FOC77_05515 [Niallia circulans]